MAVTDTARLVPKRYRVTFANVADERFTYHVCSCLDERKALVIAAGHHSRSQPRADEGPGLRGPSKWSFPCTRDDEGPFNEIYGDRAELVW
jgi:hypothetical protein